MISKRTYQSSSIIFLLLIINCIGINREWEELESEYDHVLNVFGILNLDPVSTSFIGLYRTTDLNEVSQKFSRVDTLYYCECDNGGEKEDESCWCESDDGYWVVDSIYEPAAIIKDASIHITDDLGRSFEFNFIENLTRIDSLSIDTTLNIDGYVIELDTTIFDTSDTRINFYVDTTGSFSPEPGRGYTLNVTAPGYNPISGNLKTPLKPKINSVYQRGDLIDTVIVNEPFEISYGREETGRALITGQVLLGDWWNDSTSLGWCGGEFEPFMVDLDDGEQYKQTIEPWICLEESDQENVKDYVLRLTSMDDNYYEYFIVGESGEYSNTLLNYPTTKGRSVGLEGGFGLFGSIASDWKTVKIIRK